MLALGSVAAGTGILLVALLTLVFRHPSAARWTGSELVVMLLGVPVTALIGFGVGHVVYGFWRVLKGSEPALETVVPVVVAAALAAVIPPVRRRLRSYAVAAGPTLVSSLPEVTLGIDQPPHSPAPSRPRRAA